LIKNKKILAIVPARSGSKGLLNKNIKILNNKPLIYWPIQAVKKSKYIDKAILSTDSKKIQKISLKYGIGSPFLRPKKISLDKTPTFEVIKHAINFFSNQNTFFDYVVLLEPTSPLTTSDDVDAAIEKLHKNKKKADSIVSVSENVNQHPDFNVKVKKNGMLTKFITKQVKRRQDISKVFFFDGSLYISKTCSYLKNKTFFHNKTVAFVSPKWKSFEIDDIVDLICVEAIMKNVKKLNKVKK
jgi:N-acylneuraminate cytidylyltransferase/CMP-N,N'-diacetyllegionaminic acid synthase